MSSIPALVLSLFILSSFSTSHSKAFPADAAKESKNDLEMLDMALTSDPEAGQEAMGDMEEVAGMSAKGEGARFTKVADAALFM